MDRFSIALEKPIHADLKGLLENVKDMFQEEDIEIFKKMPEKDLLSFHHNFGRNLRNKFGLWEKGNPIVTWFMEELEIWHADDIYSMLITTLHRSLNGKETRIEEQALSYKNYWKRMGITFGKCDVCGKDRKELKETQDESILSVLNKEYKTSISICMKCQKDLNSDKQKNYRPTEPVEALQNILGVNR